MKYLLLIVLVLGTQANLRKVDDFAKCFEELQDMYTVCKDIIAQASSGSPDFSQILADATKIANDVSAAQKDCKFSSPSKTQDIAHCISDVEDMMVQVKDIISQAKSGKPNFAQLLQDVQKITTDVKAAQSDCNLNKVGNFADCTGDLQTIVAAATAIIQDGSSMNFVKLIADVKTLVTAAQAAQKDCTAVKRVANMPSCIADVEDIVKVLQDVVSQASSGKPDFAKLLQDVQTIMGDVTKAEQDCNFGKKTVQGSCAADLEAVVTDALQLVKDASSKNIVGVLGDLKQLKTDIMTAKTDCNQSNDLGSCMTDVQQLLATAEDLVSQVTAKQPNLAKILSDVQNLVSEAKKAEQDCVANKKVMTDEEMCKKDVMAFAAGYKKMWASAKAHNADDLKAELQFMMKDNTEIQKVCHLQGECMKDSQMMSKMIDYVMHIKQSDDWKPVFQALGKMGKMMKTAERDCHGHGPAPHNVCQKDLHMLKADYKKMWATVKAQKADDLKAELQFMMKDNTEIQKVCHLQGECMKDSQMLTTQVQEMMKATQTETIAWDALFVNLKNMGRLFKKAGQDCHHGPAPHNVCQKDLHMLMADFHKMWKSAKGKDQKALKLELEFMVKDNADIQKVCHLQGECMKDSQMLTMLAEKMMKLQAKGDWKDTFKSLMAMRGVFQKAGKDCHQSPRPHMKCRRDIKMLEKDLKYMMQSAKKQDSEHLMQEAQMLEKALPTMETDCNMKGMCKKDFDALEGMVKRFETVMAAKDWKQTDEALIILEKSFKAAGTDCHHHTHKRGHKKHHKKHGKKSHFKKIFKKIGDEDQCKTDIKTMMEDIQKMVDDVKTHNQNATEATLKYIVDNMPALEKQCQLSGECAKDFWMVDGLAKRMYESTEKGDWNQTDAYCKDMFEVFHKAHNDCQHGPKPDQCKTDAENLEADVHKIFTSVKAQDQKATEAELSYLIKEMPMFEEACHLHGQCKMDMDHIQHIAEWALNNTMAGDWNHTEYALHRMVEVFGEAKKDCDDHPTPPSPEECEKAEWVMEDTLQGLIASVGDKYAEGAEHFSAELEHRVFWIERACQLHDMCKSDWDRIGHISHGIYDEVHRGNWEVTDAATVEIVEIVKTDIRQDCHHNRQKMIEIGQVGDMAQCMKDVQGLVAAAEDIVKVVESGNIDIAAILKDAQTIAADVKAAENDCNFSDEQRKKVDDLPTCMKDVKDIVTNAEDILSQVQSGKPNFAALITDVENIMADVKKAQSDCNMSKVGERDIMHCLQEVEEMVMSAKDIIAQATSGKPDFTKMIADVELIAKDVTRAETDCKLARSFRFPVYNDATCKADMATLAKEAFMLLKDASSHNWTKMLVELPEMIKTIKQAEADC